MPETSSPTAADDMPLEDVVDAGVYPSASAGFERGLVVLATGSEYWLVPHEAGHRLLVPAAAWPRVSVQLEKYERESAHWPPAPYTGAAGRLEFVGPMVWALATFGVFAAQQRWPQVTVHGALDASQVWRDGEIWRAGTALFLHASPDHILSNTLSGIFVFSVLTATLGRAKGWLLLLISAVVANLAVAAVHFGSEYRSLGASTAVFAALGLLTGHAAVAASRVRDGWRWRALFVPLASGLVVLGLYGAGADPATVERIDVGAHAAGFCAGLLCALTAFGAVKASPQSV